MTEKRGGGYGPVGEHGETDREVSLVDIVWLVESSDGDLGVSNVKLASNMVLCVARAKDLDRSRMRV